MHYCYFMEIKEKITKLLKQSNVFDSLNFIVVYGSVSKNKQTPLSDIDVCISLSLLIKERTKLRLKLLSNLPEKFDLQIFEDLPIYLKKEVLQGELLYCKNKKNLINLSLEIIKEYEDFKPIYDYYLAKDKSKVEI